MAIFRMLKYTANSLGHSHVRPGPFISKVEWPISFLAALVPSVVPPECPLKVDQGENQLKS